MATPTQAPVPPAAAIGLTATPTAGTAPLAVVFQVTIPKGVGTGCEAFYYDFGDGAMADLYTPCGYVVPALAPGATPVTFVPPTDPPRGIPELTNWSHTYERPGTYTARFELRKNNVTMTYISNTITIVVR